MGGGYYGLLENEMRKFTVQFSKEFSKKERSKIENFITFRKLRDHDRPQQLVSTSTGVRKPKCNKET